MLETPKNQCYRTLFTVHMCVCDWCLTFWRLGMYLSPGGGKVCIDKADLSPRLLMDLDAYSQKYLCIECTHKYRNWISTFIMQVNLTATLTKPNQENKDFYMASCSNATSTCSCCRRRTANTFRNTRGGNDVCSAGHFWMHGGGNTQRW